MPRFTGAASEANASERKRRDRVVHLRSFAAKSQFRGSGWQATRRSRVQHDVWDEEIAARIAVPVPVPIACIAGFGSRRGERLPGPRDSVR